MARDFARDYLSKARVAYEQAEECFSKEDWSVCVARVSESIEFSLKSILRLHDIRYGRDHDVSGVLVREIRRFPDWFRSLIPRFRLLSSLIIPLSPYARYGDELLNAPASILFSKNEAQMFLENAKEIFDACIKLFDEPDE